MIRKKIFLVPDVAQYATVRIVTSASAILVVLNQDVMRLSGLNRSMTSLAEES